MKKRIEITIHDVIETWYDNGQFVVALDVDNADYRSMRNELNESCIDYGEHRGTSSIPVAINFTPPEIIIPRRPRKPRITSTDVEWFIGGVITAIMVCLFLFLTKYLIGLI